MNTERKIIDGRPPRADDEGIEDYISGEFNVDKYLPELPEVPVDKLRGQEFIGVIVRYDNPQDLAFGETIDRLCVNCFFRGGVSNVNRDCYIDLKDKHPKKLFGFGLEDFLPMQIDGKEVGNYCKYFTDWRTE